MGGDQIPQQASEKEDVSENRGSRSRGCLQKIGGPVIGGELGMINEVHAMQSFQKSVVLA